MIEILNLRATNDPKVFIVNGLHEIGEADENYSNVLQWVADGKEVMPPLSDSDIQAINEQNLKAQKQALLDSIIVTTSTGKVFDGREKDVPLMSGAIQAAEVLGLTEHQWKLHDNTVAVVTLLELKEALALAMQKIGEIKVL